MELPRVKIQFLNGQLGTVGESEDGLMALMCGAVAVGDTFAIGTPYDVESMDDVAELGITAENNAALYQHLKAFYNEAESGTKVVVYGVTATTKPSEVCDYTKTDAPSLRDLIAKENGKLRGVGLCGMAADGLATVLANAQKTAEWSTTELYAPLFVATEYKGYDGKTALPDLTQMQYNRCCVVVGDEVSGGAGACIGTLLGRVASIGVQRNIGRVKDGALAPVTMWLGAKKIDESQSAVSDAHGKGYIVPRKHGRSGYYFANDPMATDPTEDYATLANRRVIDKAYRIAYDTMLDMLLDDIECNTDGTIQTAVAKSWQQTVENAINQQMTANGELSTDEDGSGCEVYVDETQNLISTSKVVVTLKVQPRGYARYIDVNLGFRVGTE